jgi:DnaJ-class molecular chaperone
VVSLKNAIEILQNHDLREAAMEGACNRVERLERIMSDCHSSIQPFIRTGEALGGDPTTGGLLGTLIDLSWALQEKCPICKGEGTVPLGGAKAYCPKCSGSGQYPDSFE